MRSRTLILLLVALVLAGGTTIMARSWLASQRGVRGEASPIAVPTPARSVLIARSTIERGRIIKPSDLAWEPWPEGGVDKNYVLLGTRTPETYTGWVAKQPIAAGEPLTETKIIAPGNRGFLAAVLRPGMRAVSVPVTLTSGISGFVFPGDSVDLIVTYSVQDRPASSDKQAASAPLDHKISETVLREIRVLAIDQKLESKPGEATVAKSATFEVTPKQSEVIALANEMGKLSLSLRSLVPGPSETNQEVNDKSPSAPIVVAASAVPVVASAAAETASPTSAAPGTPLSASYTLDSDISPLLHSPDGVRSRGGVDGVTILRGGQSSATSITQQP